MNRRPLGVGQVSVFQPPIGQVRGLLSPGAPTRPSRGLGKILVKVQVGQAIAQFIKRRDHPERVALRPTHLETTQVPADVFAHFTHRSVFVAFFFHTPARMGFNDGGNLAKRRCWESRPPVVGGDDIAENPRTPLSASANRNAIAPGLTQHFNCIPGLENIAITEDRNIQGFFDARNVIPVRVARVMLSLRARMNRHGRGTKFLGDLRGLEAGFVLAINSHADLYRHRDLTATRIPTDLCLGNNRA